MLLISCSTSPNTADLEGKWRITEMYSSGIKSTFAGWIVFEEDGTYAAVLGDSSNEMQGNWKVHKDNIHLWQKEINDLHGNRVAEPYNSTWTYFHAGEYLVLEGLPAFDVQHLKLVLQKSE